MAKKPKTREQALKALTDAAGCAPDRLSRDDYYMAIARAAEARACCVGSKVGAVIVKDNRVVSTGYNGTPEGFPNCDTHEWGCVRCADSKLIAQGFKKFATDVSHTRGRSLDRCVCVHAEQNALLAAAKYGISVKGATLYTTVKPCFGCLKESIQAGIAEILYADKYAGWGNKEVTKMYKDLAGRIKVRRHRLPARTP